MRERIDIETARECGAHVFQPVGDREREFLRGRRTRLVHVIAGDRDRIEFRKVRGRIFDHVGDDAHRRGRRIDVRIANHELFEDVVLNRALQRFARDALLLRRDDEEREARQHGTVHRHRDGRTIERNALEEQRHILDRIDRDAGLSDVARHPRIVGIVAAMGRQIEGDRERALALREAGAIGRIGGGGSRKAGILPQRPRAPAIHARPNPTCKRKLPREAQVRGIAIFRPVHRRDCDTVERSSLAFGVVRLSSEALAPTIGIPS